MKPPIHLFDVIGSILIILLFRVHHVIGVNEKSVLFRLFEETGANQWEKTMGWSDPANTPVCTWYGVTCDEEGFVTDINLNYNNLSGKIPSDVWQLTKLRHFSAQDNRITGAGFEGFENLPEFTALQTVDLNGNNLVHLEGIKNAPQTLQSLYLNNNKISGPFPNGLLDLNNLQELKLNFNKLTGTIPRRISQMSSLIEFYLYGNSLTGTIPTEIGQLQKLNLITLAENQLKGTIPNEVNNLLNIQTFSIHNNLVGAGSLSGTVPSFSNAPFIDTLLLDGNSLTGTIPLNLLASSQQLDDQVEIGLSDNMLTGSVPLILTKFSDLVLDIAGNRLTYMPPEMCMKSKWMDGDVAQLGCDAIACPIGTYNPKNGRVESIDDTDDEYYSGSSSSEEDDSYYDDGKCSPCKSDPLPYIGSYTCPGEENESVELTALDAFYSNMAPEKWLDRGGWDVFDSAGDDDEYYNVYIDDAANYCDTFYGLRCNDEGRITEIRLPFNGLKGQIHRSLFDLEFLEVLDLSYNEVWFPDALFGEEGYDEYPSYGFHGVSGSKNLRELIMSGTQTKNWSGISKASNLESLYLDDVPMEATINYEVFSLSNLKTFSAKSSNLKGSLDGIVGMRNLESLNLYYNDITGTIPSGIGELRQLQVLDLSENLLKGTIPTELGNLWNLQQCSMHNRQRDGPGFSGRLPSLYNMKMLEFLSLDSNSLQGPIPSDFLQGISSKSKRLEIGLSFNELNGDIPLSLENFDDLYIDLAGNKITSLNSNLCQNDKWMDGEVGQVRKTANACNAILCPTGTLSLLGYASTLSDESCEVCVSNTDYYGATSCSSNGNGNENGDDSEKEIMMKLFHATGGQYWDNTYDIWDDSSVMCDSNGVKFYGVTCDENGKVVEINLEQNNLAGKIPSDIWNLKQLRTLRLSGNFVEVDFFLEYGSDNTVLEYLDVSSTNMPDLSGIDSFRNLKTLNISRNNLNGMIPSFIYEMDSLQSLYMDGNHFEGSISKSIEDLVKLRVLSCSLCNLNGVIPSEIGSLPELTELRLDQNMLTGTIPSEINDLSSLKKLELQYQRGSGSLFGPLIDFSQAPSIELIDLSRNALTGAVPRSFLEDVYSSTNNLLIDLSFNQISGTVPEQLQRFSNLYLDLAGNKITGLPDVLCDKGGWMNNKVEAYKCDAILCKPGYKAEKGRQVGANSYCVACNSGSSMYYGSTECKSFVAKNKERTALEEFYDSLGGQNWIDQRNWKDEGQDSNVCNWFGIRCEESGVDDENHIVSIKLDSNNLVGTVPSEIFSLPQLRTLKISGNNVNFDLSFVNGPVQTLEYLAFASIMNTTNINRIGAFPNLKELYFANSKAGGSLPDELFDLTQLKSLEISSNSFEGSLDGWQIQKLINLEEFFASNNEFTGSIPTEMGQLMKLRTLDLSSNNLSSTLPSQLNRLNKLSRLSLQKQKSGGIHGPLLSFSNIDRLRTLELQNNKLTGNIPSNFLSESSLKYEMVDINLDFNEISGTIPFSLKDFEKLNLYIAGNQMLDIPDSLCGDPRIEGWMDGNVASLGCKAIGCPVGSYSPSGRESLEHLCYKCSNNKYIGSTVCATNTAEEVGILMALYAKTDGDSWDSSINWMDTDISVCYWEGISCEGNLGPDSGGITGIDLEGFGLVGTVPSAIFTLPYLTSLNLSDNTIDISFGKVGEARLEMLKLSDTGLESLDGLSNAKSLKTLHLTDNKISTTLDDSGILDLPQLEELYISFNKFHGQIPNNIGKLSNLGYFYAYDNNFAGKIPPGIGQLKNLKEFVLSENLLSGQLPLQLGSLSNLELFSAYRHLKSGAKLSGTLPSFENCVSLERLYLDYNNIGGTIPSNFLVNSNRIEEITMAGNVLSGKVPGSLGILPENLLIELAGNKFNDMDGSLCGKSSWNYGLVDEYGCNAILCRPEFANNYGMAIFESGDSLESTSCSACPGGINNAKFWGSTSCEAVLEQREILKILYAQCGGSNWQNKDKWMSSEDECKWYGITCNVDKQVTRIVFDSNNVRGKPPSELFQLRFLEELCFHNNEILWSFDGIENARELVTLHLGKTGLSSLEGLEKATSLKMIQLTSNNLSGGFPANLFELRNLETIDLQDNLLSGPLPNEFSDLPYLTNLNIDHNQFSGTLPSFKNSTSLTRIDLGYNSFTGTIPTNFLQGLSRKQSVYVDLIANNIEGDIPTELDRFSELYLFLSDNKITVVPPSLCDADNDIWFNGQIGEFGCMALLCPPGTYNEKGRQDNSNSVCKACDSARFYGSTTCERDRIYTTSDSNSIGAYSWIVFSTIVATLYILVL